MNNKRDHTQNQTSKTINNIQQQKWFAIGFTDIFDVPWEKYLKKSWIQSKQNTLKSI
jgi:hypothetical protein